MIGETPDVSLFYGSCAKGHTMFKCDCPDRPRMPGLRVDGIDGLKAFLEEYCAGPYQVLQNGHILHLVKRQQGLTDGFAPGDDSTR